MGEANVFSFYIADMRGLSILFGYVNGAVCLHFQLIGLTLSVYCKKTKDNKWF
jgi:hypothetical protein